VKLQTNAGKKEAESTHGLEVHEEFHEELEVRKGGGFCC
jgi:hypothetical protein